MQYAKYNVMQGASPRQTRGRRGYGLPVGRCCAPCLRQALRLAGAPYRLSSGLPITCAWGVRTWV